MPDTSALYITDPEFRAYIQDDSTGDTGPITQAIRSASRSVDKHCGRWFNQRPRIMYFSPNLNDTDHTTYLRLDADIATTSGLAVATGAGYTTTWTLGTDFVCEPVNQMSQGIDGWPYTALRTVGSPRWPTRTSAQADTVRVTATFGWALVPDEIKQATAILAAMYWKLGSAPLGVAGFNEFGSVRVRDIPQVASLLSDFRRDGSFGVA